MSNSKQELETILSINDRASDKLDEVADKAAKLEQSNPEVTATADDKASAELEKVDREVKALDGETATVDAVADDKATADLEKVDREVKALDGETAEVKATADDEASDPLEEIRGKLDRLDGGTAEVLLKTEKRQASRDLGAFRRELIALDGEGGEVEIKADIAEAERKLAALDAELDSIDGRKVEAQAAVDVDDAGVEGAGSSAANLFGGGFVGALGGAGIAAAIVETIGEGSNRIGIRARFEAEFGLVKDDAERLSKEASDIYSGNWGDSFEQVHDAIGLVQQSLVATGQVAATEAQGIAEGALVIADVWGIDAQEAIRGVGQIMKNGLAPDAQSAMDVVVEALQNGANGAGDLFESIDEYAQHVSDFGLNIEDLMSIFTVGMANGERDTDKLADAIKEMSLRATDSSETVSAAYSDLGLDADKYRLKILEGGTAAREAYVEILTAIQSVDDPIERNRLAIEFLGTQFEDLGPTALESLLSIGDGLVETTGALDEVNVKVSESASEWDKLSRRAKGALGNVAEDAAGWANATVDAVTLADDAMDRYLDGLKQLEDRDFTSLEEVTRWANSLGVEADVTTGLIYAWKSAQEDLGRVFVESASPAQDMVQASIDQALATKNATEATEAAESATDDKADADSDAADASEEATAALEAQIDALQEEANALNASISAQRRAVDSTYALRDSETEFKTELEAVSEKLVEATGNYGEIKGIMDDVALSAASVADASVRVAEDTAAANGTTFTATQRQDAWNKKMLQSAATATGPMRSAIIDYVGEVNGIPPEKVSNIKAEIDRGRIAAAESALENTSRTRPSAVNADAITSQANADLNYLTRDRPVNLYPRVGPTTGSFGYSHVGSRFAAGESKFVVPGQVFTPDRPGRLSSVEESRRLTSSDGHGQSSRQVPLVIQLMGAGQVETMITQRDADMLAEFQAGAR